jgi:hypothetical protein
MILSILVAILLHFYSNNIDSIIDENFSSIFEAMKEIVYSKLDMSDGDVSLEARSLFDNLWYDIVSSHGSENKFVFPPHIVLLNGAPGSGKKI